jgi:hypothetical protein
MIWLLPLALLAALTTAGNGGAPVAQNETVLVQLQQTLARAWIDGDRATLERIIASDWRSTGPDGRMTDRPRVLSDVFETRIHKIRRLEIDDVNVRVFGDAAVVTGRTRGVGEFGATPYDVVIRFTDTFVRREGRWQAVASHASLVSAAQADRLPRHWIEPRTVPADDDPKHRREAGARCDGRRSVWPGPPAFVKTSP